MADWLAITKPHQLKQPTVHTTLQAQLNAARQALANHSDSAALDAEVLLCHVLNKPRTYLRTWPEQTLTPTQLNVFHELIQQRRSGKPIAYLTGKREFWSREFTVTPDVLIPRPDTECLIELSLMLIPSDSACNIADLGTGSGIIAITLAAERPHTQVLACDLSPTALAVARSNAAQHQLNNVRFYQSNWFAELPKQPFRLIVSNPPYIAEDDPHLQQGDVRFEPGSALIAAERGLSDIKTIAEQARSWLEPDGHLLIEHGYDQEEAVQAIFKGLGYVNVETYRDLSGQPRVSYGQLPPNLRY